MDNTGINTRTIDNLNELLATFQLYYQNLRGFHWNIKGNQFFELHIKFEEWYNLAALKIDEVAERILTLNGEPLHTFQDYLNVSKIETVKRESTAEGTMQHVFDMHVVLLDLLRNAAKAASEKEDEGTVDLLTPMISELEKINWMVGAWLK